MMVCFLFQLAHLRYWIEFLLLIDFDLLSYKVQLLIVFCFYSKVHWRFDEEVLLFEHNHVFKQVKQQYSNGSVGHNNRQLF